MISSARQPSQGVVLQPVVDLRDGSVFAHQASFDEVAGVPVSRALSTPEPHGPAPVLRNLDQRSTQIILARWCEMPDRRRLLLKLSADTFVGSMLEASDGWLMQALKALGISEDRLIIEITGSGRPWDGAVLCDAVKAMRAAGARLALGDDGAGHASFHSWSEVEPEYVRVGKRWIAGIASDSRKRTIVRTFAELAEAFGTQLVAEGIDHDADLRVVSSLGIAYGQGNHFTRVPDERKAAASLVNSSGAAGGGTTSAPGGSQALRRAALRSISVIQAPSLSLSTTNDEVAAVFQERPELHALAVVEGGFPIALIPRQRFMDEYARLYFREVRGRKACIDSANPAPCVIERDADIETLAGVLTSASQRYLSEGFIVTEGGQYVGLGTGDQLIRVVTETRLEAARHANPLTFLPGNIPVSLHIDGLLGGGLAFVACHADLDNFKPFNDRYGFARGDEMIRLTARLVLSHCDSQRDFVGHLGGDDFMIVFQSPDWQARCQGIIRTFQEEARALLDEDARVAGGFEAEDRHGVQRFFPCTTISIGAVSVAPGTYQRAEQVATDAALAKHDAKLSATGMAVRIAGA